MKDQKVFVEHRHGVVGSWSVGFSYQHDRNDLKVEANCDGDPVISIEGGEVLVVSKPQRDQNAVRSDARRQVVEVTRCVDDCGSHYLTIDGAVSGDEGSWKELGFKRWHVHLGGRRQTARECAPEQARSGNRRRGREDVRTNETSQIGSHPLGGLTGADRRGHGGDGLRVGEPKFEVDALVPIGRSQQFRVQL